MNEADNKQFEKQKSETPPVHFTGEGQSDSGMDDKVNALTVPPLEEFRAMCSGLRRDCMKEGLGLNAGGTYCNQYTCRSCAPLLFYDAVTSAFATAENHGLRYRLSVSPYPSSMASEHAVILMKEHRHLMNDARLSHGSEFSFICSFGLGTDGRMRLEEFVNVDYSKSIGLPKSMPLILKVLGKTCRRIVKSGCITFREISPESVRREILSMVRNVIALMSGGSSPLWAISSSLDIGISGKRSLR